ncbi:MAG: anthranilate synthase component I family protein [Flavitalea sp.]
MLNWANQFNICCFLDNNEYNSGYSNIECLLGAGVLKSVKATAGEAFKALAEFAATHNDWMFGHLGFELKTETEGERGSTPKYDPIGFDDLLFFVPEIVIELTATDIRIGVHGSDHEQVYRNIMECTATVPQQPASNDASAIHQRYSRDEYISVIKKLQQHILRGDCYEINFCQEFYAEKPGLEPLTLFRKLTGASPNPFSAFYRNDSRYLLCASPERYLQKKGTKVISQPIKGTLKRDRVNSAAADDLLNAKVLFESAKDRSENVMVVDLVRNDLSRICGQGSVVVDELFGIYTFPQVYQMISTISGELSEDVSWLEAIRATFPMGSMTGAPKRRVLQLIDQYERSARGLFSGAVGYVTPERDFDFNVVIRSILYNSESGYLSFPAGSGITFYSDAEAEYEECLVKAAAIRGILGSEAS